MGLYGHHVSIKPGSDVVPTSDCCGSIVKLGAGAADNSGFNEGDRVVPIFNQTHLTGQIAANDLVSYSSKYIKTI